MKYLILTTLSVFILIGCSTEKKSQETPSNAVEQTSESLSFGMVEIEEKSTECKSEPCASVAISYPDFDEATEASRALNDMVINKITTILSEDYVMEARGSENMSELIDLFLKSYQDFKESFPESKTPWTISINIDKSYDNQSLISLQVTTDSYTGGAHPNSSVSYLNILKDGMVSASLSDIVSDQNQLSKLVEAQFRKENGLSLNASLSESGYNFENDQFQLPKTFGFTKSGLAFYYNSYEIAAYAEGPTEIIIPYGEVAALLRP